MEEGQMNTQNTDVSNRQSGSRILDATIVGAITASLFMVFLTLAAEFIAPIKALLAEQHHHHWVGKGVWSGVVFVLFGAAYGIFMKGGSPQRTSLLLLTLSVTLLLALVVLFGFFAYEYTAHI